MKRTHLPLNGLRVLDAAARHLSFTRAADELAVTPAVASDQAKTATPDKLICKTYDTTGSLVRKTRICRTKAEWDKAALDAEAEAERLNPHITTEHEI